MEFVEGDNLRERLRRGPLEMRQVLDVGIQIVDGLAAAHAVGIVHRDLKPENLMLRPDGLAKILDFGLAKLLRDTDPGLTRQPAASGASDETIVSASFGASGSADGARSRARSYMPEQVRGESADARSDIFAVGCVLYELTAGQRPFGTGPAIGSCAILGIGAPGARAAIRSADDASAQGDGESPGALPDARIGDRLAGACAVKSNQGR
jgi:serine/threonine protein kinase